jgi:hypothetical protein
MTLKIYIEENFHNKNWIQSYILKNPSLKYKFNYYWIGLINNEKHKHNYLEFRSQIEVLKERSIAIQSDLFRLVQEKERTKSQKNIDHCLDDDVIYMFQEVEKILLKYHKLLWCTRAPIHNFLDSYFKIRNNVLFNDNTNCNLSIDKRLNKTTSIIMELDVISEFIKSSVDINDQLMFKVFLLFINIITLFGQYYWFGNLKQIYCA